MFTQKCVTVKHAVSMKYWLIKITNFHKAYSLKHMSKAYFCHDLEQNTQLTTLNNACFKWFVYTTLTSKTSEFYCKLLSLRFRFLS